MDLFKWTKNIKPKFPNIVENFFGKKIDDEVKDVEAVATVPSVNIEDKKKAFEVSLALPGVDKKDVNIEIVDDKLVISSEKQYQNEESDGNWMRKEYGYASFQRIFQLPENSNPDKIDASMKKGVLKISVGKLKEGSPTKKKIELT
jgi:HSP20 family protein